MRKIVWRFLAIALLGSQFSACGSSPLSSVQTSPDLSPGLAPSKILGFAAMGDSIVAGYGVAKSAGQIPQFYAYLQNRYQPDTALLDASRVGATSTGIRNNQLKAVSDFVRGKALDGVVTVVNAGGNDLLNFQYSNAYQSTCAQGNQQACFRSLAPVLDSSEANLNTIFSTLREAAGPGNRIMVLTYANVRRAARCGSALESQLFDAALEGVPNTPFNRGLNTRIRQLASRYEVDVIDLYKLFRNNADTTTAGDCIHPNTTGHQLIYQELVRVFEAGKA